MINFQFHCCRGKIILLIVVILFNGCTHLPPPPTAATQRLWQTHQTKLKQVTNWILDGRIAVTNLEDNWSAKVYWRQYPDHYELRFNAPLGQGGLLLTGDRNRVTMRTSQNQTFTATNPEQLIAKTLQLEIPVTHLYFWIRGLPMPSLPTSELLLDEEGHLYRFQQEGWEVSYQRYSNESGIALPGKLYLENGRFKVKMVISQWKLPSDKIN